MFGQNRAGATKARSRRDATGFSRLEYGFQVDQASLDGLQRADQVRKFQPRKFGQGLLVDPIGSRRSTSSSGYRWV
jgi:hypothetical protein